MSQSLQGSPMLRTANSLVRILFCNRKATFEIANTLFAVVPNTKNFVLQQK